MPEANDVTKTDVTKTKVVWLNLTSSDPRKKPALALIRKAAGVATGRVTICKITKDGSRVKGDVLAINKTVEVEFKPEGV